MPVTVSMKELLHAGVHFGHQTRRWNPRMRPYVYGSRNGIYIIDLQQTANLAKEALKFVTDVTAEGKFILFVGTKKQARPIITAEAKRSGQYYVAHRWLGGMLTNYLTIRQSIDRLVRYEDVMNDEAKSKLIGKKELSMISKKAKRLSDNLGGIRNMKKLPGALFVMDIVKEHTAVLEAKKLGIPVIGIVDTNCDPTAVDYPIPGNDDALRSISLFSKLIADACLDGHNQYRLKGGKLDDDDKLQMESRFEGDIDLMLGEPGEEDANAIKEAAIGDLAAPNDEDKE